MTPTFMQADFAMRRAQTIYRESQKPSGEDA